ncbi:hypothetical protein [Sphingomonas sp.]|uniref:hypothetical protein n=1 Tax=Sphingomonas sp. TaxID=28214 RepID=UPI003AFF98EE
MSDPTQQPSSPPLTPDETQLPGDDAPGETPAQVTRLTNDVDAGDMFVQGGE